MVATGKPHGQNMTTRKNSILRKSEHKKRKSEQNIQSLIPDYSNKILSREEYGCRKIEAWDAWV